MAIHNKTKTELIAEVEELHQHIAKLKEQLQAGGESVSREGHYHYLFDALFNTHLDAVYILDRNGRFLDVNQVAQQRYGCSREEFLEMSLKDLSPLEMREIEIPGFQESLLRGGVFEWRHLNQAGSEFPVEISVVPFLFEENPAVLATAHDISERRQAENALLESEERFRAIVTSMDDIVYTLDTEQRHTGVFGEWVERDGVKQDFFLGKTAREILGSEAAQIHEKYNERALAGEKVVYEWLLPINGHVRYYQTAVSPIHGEDGSRYGLVGVGRDITKLRQAEEALRENETRFANVIASAMDAIISVDKNQQIVLFNSAAEKMFGYQAGETIGKPLHILIPERFRKRHENLVYAFGKTRVTNRSMGNLEPVFGVDKNGREFPIEASISHHEEQGQHLYTVILRDISERQRAEEARRILETRVQTVMDTMIGGGQIIGFDWRYLYLNDAVVAQSGYASRDDLIGFTMMEKYPGIEQTELFKTLQQCMEHRIIQRMETEFTFPDGSSGWFDLAVHPVPEGIFILSYDITEQKRAETERKAQAIQMIEDQRLKSLGLLAGGVAHDINNLLTPIGLNIEIMRMAHAPTPKARQLLQSLENTTQKIGGIVQQLLAYAGHGEPALGEMDMSKLVEDIYTLLHASLPKNVDLQLDLTAESLPMLGDRTQLEQVLMNLILNASEAFVGRLGQVVVSTSRQSEEEVVLRVRDNGPGINEENLGRIFDPFFSTKAAGRGLGLSAVQGIITGHDGLITVDSTVGVGTTFTIRLPLAWPESDSDQTADPDSDALPFHDGKWLMIDDEAIVRQATCEALGIMGLEMIEAPNGESGLELVEKHRDELAGVLLDLTMPGMSGRQVLEQLKRVYPDLPVVIASGYSEQAVQDLLTQPNVAFIAKPFNIYNLEQTMRSLMG